MPIKVAQKRNHQSDVCHSSSIARGRNGATDCGCRHVDYGRNTRKQGLVAEQLERICCDTHRPIVACRGRLTKMTAISVVHVPQPWYVCHTFSRTGTCTCTLPADSFQCKYVLFPVSMWSFLPGQGRKTCIPQYQYLYVCKPVPVNLYLYLYTCTCTCTCTRHYCFFDSAPFPAGTFATLRPRLGR
jgi:hypothetical protein